MDPFCFSIFLQNDFTLSWALSARTVGLRRGFAGESASERSQSRFRGGFCGRCLAWYGGGVRCLCCSRVMAGRCTFSGTMACKVLVLKSPVFIAVWAGTVMEWTTKGAVKYKGAWKLKDTVLCLEWDVW